jgi:hypothetical protein
MFVCKDCYAECEGQEQHPHNPACDDYDGLETEVVVETDQTALDIRDLYGALAIMASEVAELQRKFDTIIAAVVKAAGPEEER